MYPLVRAAVFCALLDANLALAMALNSGVKDPWLLLINAVAGAAVGVFAAVAIGWAIRRLHGIGCIGAIAVDQVKQVGTVAQAFAHFPSIVLHNQSFLQQTVQAPWFCH